MAEAVAEMVAEGLEAEGAAVADRAVETAARRVAGSAVGQEAGPDRGESVVDPAEEAILAWAAMAADAVAEATKAAVMVEERMVVCAAEAVRAEVARAAAAAVGARALVAEAMAVVVGWALGRLEA